MAGEGALVLQLLAGIGKAVAVGMSAAKPVEQGCNSCPEKKRKYRGATKRRPK